MGILEEDQGPPTRRHVTSLSLGFPPEGDGPAHLLLLRRRIPSKELQLLLTAPCQRGSASPCGSFLCLSSDR